MSKGDQREWTNGYKKQGGYRFHPKDAGILSGNHLWNLWANGSGKQGHTEKQMGYFVHPEIH